MIRPRTNPHHPEGARTHTGAPPDYESEVRRNILSQPLGEGTVADLDLSHDFLRRLADRALRSSFYEHFRGVVGDAGSPVSRPSDPGAASTGTALSDDHATAIAPAPEFAAAWRSLPEATPFLLSFRSPSTDPSAAAVRRIGDGTSFTDDRVLAARRLVRRHLARDGLLHTLVLVVAAAGPEKFQTEDPSPAELLADLGVPVDLLAFFDAEGSGGAGFEIIRSVASSLGAGEPVERITKSLRKAKMIPRASLPGFRPISESGLDDVGLIRLHATRATYYAAPGDGGGLDLLTETLRALPGASAMISVFDPSAGSVLTALEDAIGPRANLSAAILPQPVVVSQWAGDTAKGGAIKGHSRPIPAQIAPRFASRREYAEQLLPGDDLAIACCERAGIRTARSPLLFQGGNLLVCDDLASGARVLLAGEAEIERNRTLGLSREQAAEFLRSEFAADSCHVLPAASYHIDQEITVRSVPEGDRRTIAFVPDVGPAARLIVETALGALTSSERWPIALGNIAAAHCRAGRIRELLAEVWAQLNRDRGASSGWPLALAETLSIGPADSGVGNFHRFLLALDHLAAEVVRPGEIADQNFAALLRSYQRRSEDRARIRMILSRLGWRIVPIPAIPDDARGINPLNGIHTRTSYLMPAYGGLYAGVDRAAASVFQTAFGNSIRLAPVWTAESQRREGALHCSATLYPENLDASESK